MPELPEVETTRRGVREAIVGHAVTAFDLREPRLRWPVESRLVRELVGQHIHDVRRRAKYLLIDLDRGSLIAHLGMSGSLRVMPSGSPRLLPFVEAYTVVFEQLVRLKDGEALDRAACVEQGLVEGRQAYMLRRISSEASIGKILFEKLGLQLFDEEGVGEALIDQNVVVIAVAGAFAQEFFPDMLHLGKHGHAPGLGGGKTSRHLES